MIVLELSFPTGRYHATPWGRHVNEGAVEWPPSPWRILRALIATWHLKAKGEIAETLMRSLIEKLSVPPRFRLPRASTSHTRHFMPYNAGKNEKTTKVFDTFIHVEESSTVLIAWGVNLNEQELAALKILAARIGYFGRAEALVEARVLEGIPEIEANSAPHAEGELPPRTELIRTLAAVEPGRYTTWRDEVKSKTAAAPGKKLTAAQKKKLPRVPEDLFEALHADTGELQAVGWNLPPGAQFLNYTRLENALISASRPRTSRKGPLPQVARYAVVSNVAPRITQAVSIANRVHAALCKWSDQGNGRASVFSGVDDKGSRLEGHQHAHVFCEANGARDAVTHITIWAPMGFGEAACLALRSLDKVWGHGGHDLHLVHHGIGKLQDFTGCRLLGTATKWRSYTPFVSTLHAKTFRDGRPKIDASGWQQGSAGHDLLRHLSKHPYGAGATIRLLNERECPFKFKESGLQSLQFQTVRAGGGSRGDSSGQAFEITFREPVTGPLAFGYGAHFGLGLFVPVEEG